MGSPDENSLGVFEKQIGNVSPLWPVDTILFIIALFGLTLNVILLIVVCRRKKDWAVDTMLISVIAFHDIVWVCTLIVSLVSRWILGDSVLIEDSKWCQFSAIFYNSSFIAGVACTATLALIRYLAISYKLKISNKKWMSISILIVFTIWMFFILKGIYVKILVMPAGFYCVPEATGLGWIGTVSEWYIHTIIIVSIILIPVVYGLLVVYYYRLVKSHSQDKWVTSKLNRSMYQLIGILLAYLLATIPDTIHIILAANYNIKRTPLSDGIVMGLVFCMSIIDAVFALLLHDEIHHEFRAFIGIPIRSPDFYFIP